MERDLRNELETLKREVWKISQNSGSSSGGSVDLSDVYDEIDTKEDKVTGKGLSTNDFTTAEKNKLADIAVNANNYVLPSNVAVNDDIPTDLSELNEDTAHRVVTDGEKAAWNAKQDAVSSGQLLSTADRDLIDGLADIASSGSYSDLINAPSFSVSGNVLYIRL